MNRSELIKAVAQEVGETEVRATAVVEAVFQKIGDALVGGERVDLHGLGVFTIQNRAAKKGRNPATGEPVDVPATRVVKFRPTRVLKEKVAKAG